MLKLFEFLTRRVDRTHEESMHYWTEHHAALVKRNVKDNPKVLQYFNNVGLPREGSSGDGDTMLPYDGIVGARFDLGVDQFKETLNHQPPHNVIIADEVNFLGCRPALMVVEETIGKDARRPHQSKLMVLLKRNATLSQADAAQQFCGAYADAIAGAWGDALLKFAVNIGVPVQWGPWGVEVPPFDAVAELWFDLPTEEVRNRVLSVPALISPRLNLVGEAHPMLVRQVTQIDRLA
jgi:hypothetical protein